MPKVCIMIPTFNQAAYIIRAVESALAQDYPSIEIIVADDNSTDNTGELLQPFIKDNRIKYKKNKVNLGRVQNYNSTLHEATDAAWMINLDADDYYTNQQFISQAMVTIQKIGNDDSVLFFQGNHIIKNGEKEVQVVTAIQQPEVLMSGADYYINYFKNKHFSHMATLYNRKLALQSGFYTNDILSADIYSILNLCINYDQAQVIVSNMIAGAWFQHNNNSSNTLSIKQHRKNLAAYFDLYKKALAKGFNKKNSRKWICSAVKTYLLSYANVIFKNRKTIFK